MTVQEQILSVVVMMAHLTISNRPVELAEAVVWTVLNWQMVVQVALSYARTVRYTPATLQVLSDSIQTKQHVTVL
jgi:hypothetical protein